MATEVYINGQYCPVVNSRDNVISITRQIADISDPDSRSGDYTKRIALAGTPETDKLFSFIFEVNISLENDEVDNFTPDFNPNLKAKAVVYSQDTPSFTGDARLDSIEITRENKRVYNIEIFGTVRNFFNDIGESLVKDIDLSGLNHTWSDSVIVASWTNDYTDGYVYPMIDYGTTNDKRFWSTKDFRPTIFVRYIWDKIFESVNWSYEGDFIDTGDFSNLIIAGNGAPPARLDQDITNDTFRVTYAAGTQTLGPVKWSTPPTSISGIFSWDSVSGTIQSNLLKNTSGSEFSLAGDKYVPNGNKGKMMFRLSFTAACKYLNAAVTTADETIEVVYVITVAGPARGTTKILESFSEQYTLPSGSAQNTLTATVDTVHTTLEHEIYEDDQVSVRVFTAQVQEWPTSPTLTPTTRYDIVISQFPLFANIPRTEIWEGETYNMTKIMPREMKQRDFIMAFANMFNLYFDQVNERTLLIEPRDGGYYQAGDSNVLNWTEKLDISQQINIHPMGVLNTRVYNFSYLEGRDYLSQRYKFQYNEDYGEKKYNVNNDFLMNEKSIKLPFATAVLSNDSNTNDRILTDIRYLDSTGGQTDPSEEIRILYWGGAIPTNKKWYFRGLYGLPGLSVPFSQYPYAGHLDDPNDPNADYLFSYPKAVYYDLEGGSTQATSYTSANLFNRFYSKFIYEITDKNSRILEGYFDIDLVTWLKVDFRKLYFIKDAYYRLLEIRDFQPEKDDLTFCRFLKTEFVQAQTTEQADLIGDNEWTYEDNELPMRVRPKYKDDIVTRDGVATYDGQGNVMQGSQYIIKGDLNVVGSTALGFQGLNVSGCQVVGKNVIMGNVSDRYEPRSDVAWFNNVNLENKVTVTLSQSDISTLHTTPVELVPLCESNQYWDVTRAEFYYDHNGTTYTGGNLQIETTTNTVLLYDDTGAPISSETADLYAAMTPQYGTDLTLRMGDGIQAAASSAISGAGGEVRLTIYYRIVEV